MDFYCFALLSRKVFRSCNFLYCFVWHCLCVQRSRSENLCTTKAKVIAHRKPRHKIFHFKRAIFSDLLREFIRLKQFSATDRCYKVSACALGPSINDIIKTNDFQPPTPPCLTSIARRVIKKWNFQTPSPFPPSGGF